LQLSGKISLEFDFSSSLLLQYDPLYSQLTAKRVTSYELSYSPLPRSYLHRCWNGREHTVSDFSCSGL